jgi:hypothetical protein
MKKLYYCCIGMACLGLIMLAVLRSNPRPKQTYTVLTHFETYTGMTKKLDHTFIRHNGLEVIINGNYTAEEELHVRSNR